MTRAIFLDDGGVLSDNDRRAPQWREHLGAFLSRELGGAPERWAEANVVVFPLFWGRWLDDIARGVPLRRAMRSYDIGWLRGMAERVEVAAPDDDDAVRALTRRASRYVTERVRAFYPEVAVALRAMRASGHPLHTASGALEADLDGYLRAEGVRHLFGTLYGTDVVDTWKAGPEYYAAVFRHAGVEPADAVVVDDGEQAVGWAREAGATAYLLDRSGGSNDPIALRSLDQLLARL